MSLDILIGLAEEIAKKETDGHLSMLKFTSGWKVFLGTPDLGIESGRGEVSKLESFSTLEKALEYFIVNSQYQDVLDNIFYSEDEENMYDILGGDGENDVYMNDGV